MASSGPGPPVWRRRDWRTAAMGLACQIRSIRCSTTIKRRWTRRSTCAPAGRTTRSGSRAGPANRGRVPRRGGGRLDCGLRPDGRPDPRSLPARDEGPAPLVAFIHGGYWQALDKSDFSYLGRRFLERGVAYASLNYDLAPETRIGEMVGQVRRALAWLACRGPAPWASIPGGSTRRAIPPAATFAAMAVWRPTGRPPSGLARPPMLRRPARSAGSTTWSRSEPLLPAAGAADRRRNGAGHEPAAQPRRQGARLVCAVGGEETDEFLRQQAALRGGLARRAARRKRRRRGHRV